MPRDVRTSNRNNDKVARVYDFNEGFVTIWYKESKKPEDNQFGKIVRSLRLARNYVDATVQELNKKPLSRLATQVLGVHFGAYNKPNRRIGKFFEDIRESFKEIKQGLSGQVVLCLRKDLSGRGETMAHGKSGEHIHISREILASDDESAIARTIIHEASHTFAEMPGTSLYAALRLNEEDEEDEDEVGEIEPELYESYPKYRTQIPKEAKACADSYGWAALSFGHGHVIWSADRERDLSGDWIETFEEDVGCSHKKCVTAKKIRTVMGPPISLRNRAGSPTVGN